MSYQERDHEIVDYEAYVLDDAGVWLRGPRAELSPGGYVACVGAAQTWGCFCERPYPRLLEERLGLPVLNLGVGGAGPSFFADRPALLRHLREARLVIVQVMSGRSESNAAFDAGGREQLTRRSDGARLSAQEAWAAYIDGPTWWWPFEGTRPLAAGVLRRLRRPMVRALVRETRDNWVRSYRRLFAALPVPTILFWFSRRSPEYQEGSYDVRTLFGDFPQLIDAATFDRVKPLAGEVVNCVSRRGSPQSLVSRFTGEPTTIDPARAYGRTSEERQAYNVYYPSPEMHLDAADALEPVCRRLLGPYCT